MRPLFIILGVMATTMLCGCASKSKQHAASLAAEASRLMAGQQYEEARDKLRLASDIRPECVEYHVGIAMCSVRLKDNLTALTQYAKAERLLEGQARQDPERVDDYLMVLLCQNRDEKASAELTNAKERFPDNKTVKMLSEGYAQFAKGMSDLRVTK